MAAARAQGVAAILCSSLQPCVPPSVRAKRQEPLVPATAPSLPAWEFPSHMGAIGGVDAALLPTNQDPAPMAGSAVSCRPHPRQEPSALTRTLGSVRRGAGQPALLPRRSPAMGIPTAILWRNCAPTSQPKGRGWKPSAYGCARQCPTRHRRHRRQDPVCLSSKLVRGRRQSAKKRRDSLERHTRCVSNGVALHRNR